MSQTYACSECGEKQPSIFLCFLHCFTFHLHVDIGLEKLESLDLLSKCFVYDRAYWQVYQGVVNSELWIQRN